MSDLEKLFEHAPEGATEIAKYRDNELSWAKVTNIWWAGKQQWEERTKDWQTIATRPQPKQPRKTVEDAVEWAERRWRAGETAICELDGELYFADNNLRMRNVICTREQFEACVAAKAKSEPEWTHLVNGSECVLLDPDKDCDGYYITKTNYGSFELAKGHELTPIKPTISKDAKAQLELYVQYRIDKYGDHAMKSDLIDYLAKHEVVK